MNSHDLINDEYITQLKTISPNWNVNYISGPPNKANGKDVKIRVAIFPTENAIGSFIIIPGRTEFIEKYARNAIELINRKYNVMIIDNRGQALSDRLLDDRMLGHMDDFELAVTHIKNAYDELKGQLNGPLYVFSHSMGGMLALRLLIKNYIPEIKGAFFNAPMWWLKPVIFARQIAQVYCAIGLGNKTSLGVKYKWSPYKFEENDLTNSPQNLAHLNALLLANPLLQMGGPTGNWVNSSFKMMSGFSKENLKNINIPIMVTQAGAESIVDNDAQNRIAHDLPNGNLICVDGAKHEIYFDTEPHRLRMWEIFDGFMSQFTPDNNDLSPNNPAA